jgi:hypothetical protein
VSAYDVLAARAEVVKVKVVAAKRSNILCGREEELDG